MGLIALLTGFSDVGNIKDMKESIWSILLVSSSYCLVVVSCAQMWFEVQGHQQNIYFLAKLRFFSLSVFLPSIFFTFHGINGTFSAPVRYSKQALSSSRCSNQIGWILYPFRVNKKKQC